MELNDRETLQRNEAQKSFKETRHKNPSKKRGTKTLQRNEAQKSFKETRHELTIILPP